MTPIAKGGFKDQGLRALVLLALSWFVYVSDTGSVSFTDEQARVPAKYADHAMPVEPSSVFCYRRTTIVGAAEADRNVASACAEGDARNQVRDALGW